jgi:hypothetical protein
MPFRSNQESGSALFMALLLTTMLFALAGTYLTTSYGGSINSARELATVQARLGADDGIQLSIAELKSGVDSDADGLGTLTETDSDGRTVTVTATNLGSNVYRIHSVAVLRLARHGTDVIVERIPSAVPAYSIGSAIASKGPVQTTGSITIDGRDWNDTGTAVVGPGVYGVQCASTIAAGGNSKIGGAGLAPAKPPPAGTTVSSSNFTDGIDNDNDSVQNEELFDGLDNDGDDVVDEDTRGFPTSPDVALHLPEGSLKAAAQASGTYFTSSAQVALCVAANGGKMPGGRIIYCDFSNWQPVNLGSSFNSPPSILVQHNASSSATMTNVTGSFRGLLIVDSVQHFTGSFLLVGGVLSFSDQAIGSAFGLGNASIKYSSGVLSNLPPLGSLAKVRIRSWQRAVAR